MELPEEQSDAGEGPAENLAENPVQSWPPRIANPPTLPFMDADAPDLALDESCRPPDVPEFQPGRIARREGALVAAAEPQGAVAYRRRGPTSRTRGEAILRPTEEDSRLRLLRKRRGAAATSALLIGFLTFALASPSPLMLTGLTVGAAIAGWAAYDLGDSELTWGCSLSVLGMPLGWSHDVGGMLIASLFLFGVGWLLGFIRDASLS